MFICGYKQNVLYAGWCWLEMLYRLHDGFVNVIELRLHKRLTPIQKIRVFIKKNLINCGRTIKKFNKKPFAQVD